MRGEILYGVPVFPLNTVLFPSMPLPLHIFEERYRTMVEHMRGRDNRFCAALIREGVEVGGDADPYDIACLAEIVDLTPLPDGRFTLLAVGVERVRIHTLDRLNQPYLTGSMELWPEDNRSVEPGVFDTAQKRYLEYVGYLMKLAGKEETKIPVPDEPDLLSYVLATALQLEPEERQRLLEIPSCGERLQAELALLDSQIPLLRVMSQTPGPPSAGYGQFSAN